MALAEASVDILAEFNRFEAQFRRQLDQAIARAANRGLAAGRAFSRGFARGVNARALLAGVREALADTTSEARLAGLLAGASFRAGAEQFTRDIDVSFDVRGTGGISAGLSRITPEIQQVTRGLTTLGETATGVFSQLSRGALSSVGSFGPLLLVITALIPVIIGLSAVIAQAASGLALALGPAIAGVAASVGILALGFNRLSNALDIAEQVRQAQTRVAELTRQFGANAASTRRARDELAQLQGQLDALPPGVRAMAAAVDRARTAFTSLGDVIAERLFAGVGEQIDRLTSTVLGTFQPAIERVASAFNQLGLAILRAFELPGVQSGINALLDGIARSVTGLAPLIGQVANAFGALLRTATPFLERLLAAFAGLVARTAAWITEAERSGRLAQIFDRALDVLSQLGRIFGNLFDLTASVFSAAEEGGQSFLDTLEELTAQMAQFFATEEGRQQIARLVDAFANLAATLPALISFGQQFVTVMDRIAVLSPLNIADTFRDIGAAIDSALSAVGRFFTGIGAALAALPARIGTALSNLGPLLGEFLSQAWIVGLEFLAQTITESLIFFASIPQRIGTAMSALPGILTNLFTQAWQGAIVATQNAITTIVDFVRNLPDRLAQFFGRMRQIGGDLIRAFAQGLADLGAISGDFAQRIINRIRDFINRSIDAIERGINRATQRIGITVNIPALAHGGITDSTGLALLHPNEVVIPLERPARARQLAEQSGLTNMLGGGTGDQAPSVNVRVFIGDQELRGMIRTETDLGIARQSEALLNGPRWVGA